MRVIEEFGHSFTLLAFYLTFSLQGGTDETADNGVTDTDQCRKNRRIHTLRLFALVESHQ